MPSTDIAANCFLPGELLTAANRQTLQRLDDQHVETIAAILVELFAVYPHLLTQRNFQALVEVENARRSDLKEILTLFRLTNPTLLTSNVFDELISSADDIWVVALRALNFKPDLINPANGAALRATARDASHVIDALTILGRYNHSMVTQSTLDAIISVSARAIEIFKFFSELGRFNHSSLMTQETLQMLVDPHYDPKLLTQIFVALINANPSLIISQDNLKNLFLMLRAEHVPKILKLLIVLKNSRSTLVTQDNIQAFFSSGASDHIADIFIALHKYKRELITQETFTLLINKAHKHSSAIAKGLEILGHAHISLITYYSLNELIMAGPDAVIRAYRMISEDDFTLSADQVRADASNVVSFYALTTGRQVNYDNRNMTDQHTHSTPEISKMIFLYRYLEEHDLIPKTTDQIIGTIDRLIHYANTIDEAKFSGKLSVSSRRMFKLGVDRLLRYNERIVPGQDFNSRALVLGLFRLVEKCLQDCSIKPKILLDLQCAFIFGIRQVIEAEQDDGECLDRICISASRQGFFAGGPPNNEVANLKRIHPRCYGRLRNISTQISIFLGYPATLGDMLIFILNNLDETHLSELSSIIKNADLAIPESMQATSSLYTSGVDDQVLGHLIHIYNQGIPDGVTEKDAGVIRTFMIAESRLRARHSL